MCIQNDLKKLVALSTIQEMGFMTLLLMFPSYSNYQVLVSFVIFHTFVSGLFFWIVDCIYRRYNTRVIYNINGITNLFPNLTCFIILSTYLFIGLPFTIKFSIEIFLLKLLFNYNIFIATFICFIVNYVSIVFFFKIFIFINFGHTPYVLGTDLTKKEVLLFLLFILPILILNFL
jgi:NADH-quinone oxidoreductase subunit M